MEQFEKDEPLNKSEKKKGESQVCTKCCFAIPIILIIFAVIYLFTKNSKSSGGFFTVLVGDIGGTHVRLRLLTMSKDINVEPKDVNTTKLKTAQYPSLEGLLRDFIAPLKNKPVIAVIGIPGPVQDNKILSLPNIPQWSHEDGNKLQEKLGLKKFVFLNDFACNSYGIQTNLKLNEDYIVLNEGVKKENGPKAIIGPGTGLGMGYLIKGKSEKYYTIGNSEGGHQDFSAKNQKYFELAEFVKNEYKVELLDIEKVCSGQAMIPFYRYLLKKDNNAAERDPELGAKIDKYTDYSDKVTANEINVAITQSGLKNKCKLSRKVLELFIEVLGEAAGDMSLFTLPTGGVYLLGGISVAIENLIKSNDIFMKHFLNKNLAHLLKDIPVYLVKNGDIGMVGATECARRSLEEEL